MAHHDLVIRGGLVVDGTGAEPRVADVAVSQGLIVEVGAVNGVGREEIDARGLAVTPGFVDLHTHYDGQAIWSDRLNPSSSHGVTTVVMGNCGVGFAPCKDSDRDLLCATMEGVEDIPGAVMREGLTWTWETFPQFLDELEKRPHDIDFGVFVPHSPVRVYVMGERGANREPATDEDLARMSSLIEEGVRAGALGFATTRTTVDRRSDGEFVPSFNAARRELVAASCAVRAGGGGVIQLLPELGLTGLGPEDDFQLMEAISDASGQPITFTLLANRFPSTDFWRRLQRLTRDHNERGAAPIHPQYFARPIGVLASLELTSNPFTHTPTYKSIAHLPLPERVVEMRRPEIRARIVSENPDAALLPLTTLARMWDVMFELGDPPNYEPAPETSIAARALREGRAPEELAYELLLKDDGRGQLLVAISNYVDGLDHLFDFFEDPFAVMGQGDGGAHYGLICDSSYPTFVLTHWTRDRNGQRLSLADAVKALSATPAQVIGLNDRGFLKPGYKADINILDLDALALGAPTIVDDLPGGGRRLDQKAQGYRYTLSSGTIIARNGAPTGALPGRLVRGRRSKAERVGAV